MPQRIEAGVGDSRSLKGQFVESRKTAQMNYSGVSHARVVESQVRQVV